GGPSRTDRPGATRPTQPPEVGTHDTGRRPVPVVRNPELQGRTTHVRYDNGRVRIEAGPAATDADIQAHMETARVLQRYEGAVGKVRQLIDKVKQALTGMPGYGSQGFESRLEVQKLSNILKSLEATQAQLEESIAGATGKPTTAEQLADLERQISSVEAQLRTHAAQVDSLTAGRGYVAREDDVTPVGGPDERLPRGVAPWVSDILPPHIRPKDVVVHEGDLPSNPRPNAAYWDGQTLRVTDERRQVESVVNPERIKNLPTGVPPWVARALPPDVNPADVRVESSKVTHPEDKFNRRLSKPRPNTAYWVDGRYLYVTDSRGRVASVEGDLHLVGNPVRSESTQSLGNKGYQYTEKGRRVPVKVKVNAEVDGPIEHLKHRHDEGGHLIGAQFGGPPEFLNYVPQTRYQNGSVTNLPWDPRQRTNPNAPAASGTVRNWHEFEMDLAKHLRDGDAIRVRIRPRFISDSTNRPNEIRVDGLLTTPDGEVSRGDWRFHNTTKMDKFEKDKPEDQEPPDASAP
ncbi:MAG: DNA/RNA non-specific endonuclease, partial [Myxococcaceae bacterium]